LARINIANDIQSLTTFRRKSSQFLKQIKKTKRPIVLTVNGKAEAIVQDAAEYQRLLDIAARADVYEALRQSEDDIAHGRVQPARELFDELRRRYGIPR
jgi:prevent-host-death family protein